MRNLTLVDMKRMIKKTDDPSQVVVTPREQEVVHLLAKGLSSKKIAVQLGISFHTVESYRKHLLQKFNAKTTVEMVLKAGNVLPKEFWIQ
jgi:DNA-binding NarL/FixJ family response regulator